MGWDWDGMNGMVILGHGSSKSTFGAQKRFDSCCLYFQFQYGLITRDSSTNFTVKNKFMPVRGVSPSQLFLGTFKVFSSYLLMRINIYSKLVAFLQFWTRSLFLKYWLSPDFLPCPKAGLARQQGVLDPVFTSIVHHGLELCPPSKPETTSSSNSLVTSLLYLFIGPESDHWQCLSVTHSLTPI